MPHAEAVEPTETRIEVEGGAVPTQLLTPANARQLPALLVIPSIYGPAPDLIARLSPFADRASLVFPDPFWRVGAGAVDYSERDRAIGRLRGFDLTRCIEDMSAVLDWTKQRSNGRVAGLGICFGGPFVLRFAAEGRLAGVIAWHGSRMEKQLERAAEITCPLRLHFGEDDPVTPPEAIDAIRAAFATHPDASIVVHPGAVHGFSHDGDAHDERACQAGLDATGELLASLG